MKIGPKYKIARRLGAPVFEKTQTAKYQLSLSRKERAGEVPARPKSDYGQALIEKQKARFTYGLSERQFRSYVDKASKSINAVQKLFALLETRVDNILYRAGFVKSRAQGRQAISHGHFTVNGRRVTIPSIHLKVNDIVAPRRPLPLDQSADSERTVPLWLEVNPDKREARVAGEPRYERGEQVFDLGVVIEFYNR